MYERTTSQGTASSLKAPRPVISESAAPVNHVCVRFTPFPGPGPPESSLRPFWGTKVSRERPAINPAS